MMNYKISFQERARLGMDMLSKKSPVTLEQAKSQARLWKRKADQK
ncbi:hypothetical protein SAMN05421639_102393 [Chryseobacterium shigense]|uniref:Uncharacterized protein n=1 Tax=Chryseobacterium shigense TaxID=297244 RepID=A0A1N7I6Y2_9FLAO|nr:hypothetical protein SAMN05421639_102393 [Chryseobacterium shigense]